MNRGAQLGIRIKNALADCMLHFKTLIQSPKNFTQTVRCVIQCHYMVKTSTTDETGNSPSWGTVTGHPRLMNHPDRREYVKGS